MANTANIDEFSALKETIRTHSFENRGEEIVTTYIQHYEETLANTQQALHEQGLLLKQERLDRERERREKELERKEKELEKKEKERLLQKLREHGINPDV